MGITLNFTLKHHLGKVSKTKQKMVGFIQHSSDPSQPGRALDKKIQKNYYDFIIFIITKFGENFEDKIDICFFLNVLVKKVEVKKSD